jgi:hypothetical protein
MSGDGNVRGSKMSIYPRVSRHSLLHFNCLSGNIGYSAVVTACDIACSPCVGACDLPILSEAACHNCNNMEHQVTSWRE